MKICIYGAGAMGTSLGAELLRKNSALAIDFVTRNRAHVEALNARGAEIDSGSAQVRIPVRALLPEEMGEYDVIFLATKQRENRQIAAFLAPRLREDGALVTVQNGLPEAGLAEILGEDRVYGCALGWGAESVAPGRVEISSAGKLRLALGAYGRGDKLEALRSLLASAFIVTVGDLTEIRYSKLAVNAAFSTLSALSSLSFGQLAKEHRELVLALMRETISVAKAAGCKKLVQNGHDILKLFSSPFAGMFLSVAMRKHKNIRSGMLKDLMAGRECDADFVAGAVIREGMRLAVPTPYLSRALDVIHEIQAGRSVSPENLNLIKGVSS